MPKKQEQELLDEVEETTPEVEVKEVEKFSVLMNTQDYTIFVPYYDTEVAVAPRARVRVESDGLKDQLPEHIYKV